MQLSSHLIINQTTCLFIWPLIFWWSLSLRSQHSMCERTLKWMLSLLKLNYWMSQLNFIQQLILIHTCYISVNLLQMSLARQFLFTSHQTDLLCDSQIRYIKQWNLNANSADRQSDLKLKLYMIIWKLHARYTTNWLLIQSARPSERQFIRCLLTAWYDHSLSGSEVRRRDFY